MTTRKLYTTLRGSRAGHASLAALLVVGGVAMVIFGPNPSSADLAFTGPITPHSTWTDAEDAREILDAYCVRCHNERRLNSGLALDVLDVENPGAAARSWETVIRKLRTGTMPPGGVRRPDPAEYDLVASWLETEIDGAASAAEPNPGRTNPIHRLNRLEYNNAINDLFGLDVDVTSLLPGDETADGSFDNFCRCPLHHDHIYGAVHVTGPAGDPSCDGPPSHGSRRGNLRGSAARGTGPASE